MQQTAMTAAAGNGATWDDAAQASDRVAKERARSVEDIRARCELKRTYPTLRRVPLDVPELLQLGQRLAADLGEIESYQAQRKEIGAEIKTLREQISKTRGEVAAGKGDRRFEVQEFHDVDRQHVYLIRVDTDEVVEDRTMTASERQGELGFNAPGEIVTASEPTDDDDPELDDEDDAISADDEDDEANNG